MADKNVLHVKDTDQKLLASSKLNSTPPIGAPKAAETPAAHPMDAKSLLSLSFLNPFNSGQPKHLPNFGI